MLNPGLAQTLTLNASGVAMLLGLSEDTFLRKRPELERQGFPGRLPGLSKWSRPAILHWLQTCGGTYPAGGAGLIPNGDTEIERIVLGLEQAYCSGEAA